MEGSIMSSFGSCVFVLFVAAGLLVGCSSEKGSTDQSQEPDQAADPQAPEARDGSVEPDPPGESEVHEESDGPEESAEPAPPGEPETPAQSEEPDEPIEPAQPDAPSESEEPADPPAPSESDEPATPDEPTEPVATTNSPTPTVDVPSGPVRVQAARDGLTDVGVDRCSKCHKIQYASWLETEHAKLTPPLDCEACHGPGSEYRSLKVMKDPEASRAAGLVDPSPEFCGRCHVAGWDDELLQRSHAHKSDGGD